MKIKIDKIIMKKIGRGMGLFSVFGSGVAGMGTGTASLLQSRQRRSLISPVEMVDYSDKIKELEQKQDDEEGRMLDLMDDLSVIKKQLSDNADKISLLDTDSDYTNADIAQIRKLLEKRIDDAIVTIDLLKNQLKVHGNLDTRISAVEEAIEAVEKSEITQEQLDQLKSSIISAVEGKIKSDIKILAGCDENYTNLLTCVKNSIPELKNMAKQQQFTEQVKQKLIEVAGLLESIATPLAENQVKFEKILSEFEQIKNRVNSLDRDDLIRQNQELRQLLHEFGNYFDVYSTEGMSQSYNTVLHGYNTLTTGLKGESGSSEKTIEVHGQ